PTRRRSAQPWRATDEAGRQPPRSSPNAANSTSAPGLLDLRKERLGPRRTDEVLLLVVVANRVADRNRGRIQFPGEHQDLAEIQVRIAALPHGVAPARELDRTTCEGRC